jgi:hypothetical protein
MRLALTKSYLKGYRKASGPVTVAPSGQNTAHRPEMSVSLSSTTVDGKHPEVANDGHTPPLTPTPGGDNTIAHEPLHGLKDSSISKELPVTTRADEADNMASRRDKRGHNWRKRAHKGKPSSIREAK